MCKYIKSTASKLQGFIIVKFVREEHDEYSLRSLERASAGREPKGVPSARKLWNTAIVGVAQSRGAQFSTSEQTVLFLVCERVA